MLATAGTLSTTGTQATAMKQATTVKPTATEMPETVQTPTPRAWVRGKREKLARTTKFVKINRFLSVRFQLVQ
jgi:hypothetical protein